MIIDAHIHRGIFPAQYVFDTSLEGLLAVMDSLGIGTAISAHFLNLVAGDLVDGAKASSDE